MLVLGSAPRPRPDGDADTDEAERTDDRPDPRACHTRERLRRDHECHAQQHQGEASADSSATVSPKLRAQPGRSTRPGVALVSGHVHSRCRQREIRVA